MKNLVVLSGAGLSAESGINTFRDAGGLWEGHDVMQVASIDGWLQDPALVLDFYNKRRAQLNEVEPNDAHKFLAALEQYYQVSIITQNVDDLHERAGSKHIIHLHGELIKVRGEHTLDESIPWRKDIHIGDVNAKGQQLRPDIVWFGEEVPMILPASLLVAQADIIIIVGTSLQVYPAASLCMAAQPTAKAYYIDPNPAPLGHLRNVIDVKILKEKATIGMASLFDELTAS